MSDPALPPELARLIARSNKLIARSAEIWKEIVEVSEKIRQQQEELERASRQRKAERGNKAGGG